MNIKSLFFVSISLPSRTVVFFSRVFLVAYVSLIVGISLVSPCSASEFYQTNKQFLKQAFENNVPTGQVLWLNKQQAKQSEKIVGHSLDSLRVDYWKVKNKSAWIISEMAKEQPIITGIVIEKGVVKSVTILEDRQSNGGQVSAPFFAEQFIRMGLNKKTELNKEIVGISGAEMSVSAVKKSVRLALFLSRQIGN